MTISSVNIKLSELISPTDDITLESVENLISTLYTEQIRDYLAESLFAGKFPDNVSPKIVSTSIINGSGAQLGSQNTDVIFSVEQLLREENIPCFSLAVELETVNGSHVSESDRELIDAINEIGGFSVEVSVQINNDNINSLYGLSSEKIEESGSSDSLYQLISNGYLYVSDSSSIADAYLLTTLEEDISSKVVVSSQAITDQAADYFKAGTSLTHPFSFTSDTGLTIGGQNNILTEGTSAYVFAKDRSVNGDYYTLVGAAPVNSDGTYQLVLNDASKGILNSGSHDLVIRAVASDGTVFISNTFGYTHSEEGGLLLSGELSAPGATNEPDFEFLIQLDEKDLPLSDSGLIIDSDRLRWTFDPDYETFDSLNSGQDAFVNIAYTYNSIDGGRSSGSFQLSLLGTNDLATISGASTGSVLEDSPTQSSAKGTLNITDPDSGESYFQVLSLF